MTVRTGPCDDWIDAADLFDCGPCAAIGLADQDGALAARMVTVASEVLFHLSGRRFPGACSDTVRPCRRVVEYPTQPGWESWGSARWGVCACQAPLPHRSCGCPTLDEVYLGHAPITGITSVYVDGVLLDPSTYRVDDDRYLVRIDGEGWPCCQDLTADPTADPNTFQVVYDYGIAPPQSGVEAARVLACELYQGCTGGDCRLPQRVTSVTRQGVTMVMLDPFDFLENGKVGIYAVDLFLRTYNPHGRRRSAFVASPDVGVPVRRVGTV